VSHESDEGVDVWYCHGLHVAELRSRGVDGGNVVGSSSRGVILETEARLEATGKELVRDGDTCDGVQEEDFRPGGGTTVERVDLDFCKHFVERNKELGLILEELPRPVHVDHHDPHVRSTELLENPVTKEQKVPGVFDIQLASVSHSEKRGDFKQLRAECGGRGESFESLRRSSVIPGGVPAWCHGWRHRRMLKRRRCRRPLRCRLHQRGCRGDPWCRQRREW
jgi:hypothetical protein